MIKFDSLSSEKEFLVLHGKRSAALVNLTNLKNALEALPKDNPSIRSFERIEAKIDNRVEQSENATIAVSSYFGRMGGDALNDSSFIEYCNVETNIIGEIEFLRESYHELIKNKGLLQPATPPVLQADLVEALKSLADSTGKHAEATQAQTKASLHHHKVPEMAMSIFNPAAAF